MLLLIQLFYPMATSHPNSSEGLFFRRALDHQQRAQLFRSGASPKDMTLMIKQFLPQGHSINQARAMISNLFPWIKYCAVRSHFNPFWILERDARENYTRFWIRLYLILWFLRSKQQRNNHNDSRPLSMTMPWDIGPPLVVLWGVCWMFYYYSIGIPIDKPFVPLNEEVLNTDLDQYLYNAIEPAQHHSPNSTLQAGSDPETFNFGDFNISNFCHPWWDALPKPSIDSELMSLELSSTFSASYTPQHRYLPLSASGADADGEGCTLSQSMAVGDVDSLCPTAHQVYSTDRSLSDMANGQEWTVSDTSTAFSKTQATHNQITPATTLSPSPTPNGQGLQLLLNSEREMICTRGGCDGVTFPTMASWVSHINKHERPFKCTVAECTHPNGFSTKGLLERHIKSKHRELIPSDIAARPSSRVYYCPEPSCDRSASSSPKKPFARKDNRDNHVERQHKDIDSRNDEYSPEESRPTPDKQHLSDSSSSLVADTAPKSQAESSSNMKRRRIEEAGSVSEHSDSVPAELHRLREETQELRRKVRKLEQSLESSREKEDMLFDVIKSLKKSS